MRSYSEAALLSWVPSCSCAARFARKMASNIAPRALSRTPSPRDADFKMAAAAAGVEPERQRHPRRLFPRPGRPSTRIDSVPARQGRAALANLGIDHSAIAVSDTDQSVAFYRAGSACASPARAITGVSLPPQLPSWLAVKR